MNQISVGIVIASAILFPSIGCGVKSTTHLEIANEEQASAEPGQSNTAEGVGTMSSSDTDASYVLNHSYETISGGQESLEHLKGRVILMVNVASKCGYTRQYEGLEALYNANKDDGLVVIGFPANDFGAQEPGSNEEIAEFCSSKFDVTFPLAAKIKVKGEDAHPLYRQLADLPAPIGGEPEWNFTKFLVGRDGSVVARFDTKTEPDDPELVLMIQGLLADG